MDNTTETTETENDYDTSSSNGLDGLDIIGIIIVSTICIVILAKNFHKIFGRFKIKSKFIEFEDLPDEEDKK